MYKYICIYKRVNMHSARRVNMHASASASMHIQYECIFMHQRLPEGLFSLHIQPNRRWMHVHIQTWICMLIHTFVYTHAFSFCCSLATIWQWCRTGTCMRACPYINIYVYICRFYIHASISDYAYTSVHVFVHIFWYMRIYYKFLQMSEHFCRCII